MHDQTHSFQPGQPSWPAHVAGRTGAAIRSGAVPAARRLLEETRGADERQVALTRVALGRLLQEDGRRGLSHPTDPRLLRPGVGGSVAGVLVAGTFTAVPVVALTAMGVGPFAADEPVLADPAAPLGLDADWSLGAGVEETGGAGDLVTWVFGAFAVLGLLLLLAALAGLAGRVRALLVGARLERQGRAALAALPGGAVAAGEDDAVVEALYPRFAGMLTWTLPRRRGSTLHDHDPVDRPAAG